MGNCQGRSTNGTASVSSQSSRAQSLSRVRLSNAVAVDGEAVTGGEGRRQKAGGRRIKVKEFLVFSF
jgi:hypothetical protein